LSKSEHDAGGPAFPTFTPTEQWNEQAGTYITHMLPEGGMKLRDYFAAQALRFTLGASTDRDGAYDHVAAAIGAYRVADAMLVERAKLSEAPSVEV